MKPVIIIAIAVVLLFVPSSVYASHTDYPDYSNDPAYDGKTEFTFYQLFVSKENWDSKACEEGKNAMLYSKSQQILMAYDYRPIYSQIECVKVTGNVEYDRKEGDDSSTFGLSLEDAIKEAKSWHKYDLLIIIFDNDLSKQYFKQTKWLEDGLYYYWNGHIQYDVKTIVSATHVADDEDEVSIQTIAHEIAHNVVWQKYGNTYASLSDEKIRKKAVHYVDDLFDTCLKQNALETCPHLWTTVKTHSMDLIPVMSPDYVLEVAESMKPKPTPTPIVPKPTPKIDNFVTYLHMSSTLNGEKNYSYGFEGDRLCMTYSLRDYDNSDRSFYFTVPNKIIQVASQVLDINGNPITSYFTQDYRLDGSGKVSICDNLQLYSKNYIQNGVRYKASFAGDNTYDKTKAPTKTLYFEENQETKYNKELERITSEQQREKQILKPVAEGSKISFTNPRSVDAFGNVLTNHQVSQQIQISTDISNNNNFSQDFAIQYIVKETGDVSLITGSLSSGQSFSPTLSWIPTYSGTFTVDISLFENIENKNKLSESLTIQIIVEGETRPTTPSTSNVETNFVDKTIGIVQWLETDYPVSGTGVVRIIDPDMDFDPEVKDSFDVDVWSDSDPRGIELMVTETRKSTGIFEETVFFTTTDESSSPKLKVANGDTVTVEYEDRTLPEPHTITDELDITATTHMTDPICTDETGLIYYICQVDTVEEGEKIVEESVGWFDWFWSWFK